MRTVIAAMAAVGILVVGGFAIASTATAPAVAQEAETAVVAGPPRRGAILEEVLQGLVEDGTITEAQKTAIVDALQARIAEIREEFPGPRRPHGVLGPRIREALADGVITADELEELPDGHPLKDPDGPAAPYLDDGQLTRDELRQMRQAFLEQRRAEASTG